MNKNIFQSQILRKELSMNLFVNRKACHDIEFYLITLSWLFFDSKNYFSSKSTFKVIARENMKKTLVFVILMKFSLAFDLENPCKNITNGLLPYENDCNYFIYCLNGIKTIQRCQVGQIFDVNQLKCVLGNPETCEIFTTTTSTISSSISPPECPLIDDPLNPVFHPHPYDCDKYFLCFNGTAYERECHYGLHWSVENEWCDYPENVNCNATSTTPSPTPPFCDDWILCPRNGFGFLPNFYLCHRYFECIMAVRHMRTCPEGEIFDVISLSCQDSSAALCVIDAECTES